MLFDIAKLSLYGILKSDFLTIIEEMVTDEITEDEVWELLVTEHNDRAIRTIKRLITEEEYDEIAEEEYDEDPDKKADVTLAELYLTGSYMKSAKYDQIEDGYSSEQNEGVVLTKQNNNKSSTRFYNKAMGLLRLHYDID